MEQLFGAIRAVAGGLEANENVDEAVVFAAWSRCVGEMLRERTAPVEFQRKSLVVAVTDKTWQRNLEDLSPQMLAKINRTVGHGTVKFIEFRIDESAVTAENNDSVSKRDTEINGLMPSVIEAANAIADKNLRNNFLAAAAGYLAKQKNLRF